MREETTSDMSVTLAAWALALFGWGGLATVIINTDPRFGALPLWAFYLLWLMAATGTAVPFVRYLGRRFGGGTPPGAILRTSLWVGFFFATCAWLQLSRLLNSATAALLLIALIGVEWFLRLRDRSRWEPDDDESA
ncbi:MAG: hypothetical protein ACT4QE_21955 [Anaerolineales bacterium]